MGVAYTRGLHELGDGLWAYLQPDGGWGWSNAGLICCADRSLLVDTLFDLKLTRAMLDEMAPLLKRSPIRAAVNTHANPDHCFGNQLLPDAAEIYASAAAAAEMSELSPAELHGLKLATGMEANLRDFIDLAFGPFDFEGIELREPTRTFQGHLRLSVGERELELIELGPAHTRGDVIVHLPDAATVFTGDLLFAGGTPIAWASLSNWLSACDWIMQLGAGTLIPGHGPVTDSSGVADMRRYLAHVRDCAAECFAAGLDPGAAADEIDISDFSDWGEPERIAVNVLAAYRELDPSLPEPTAAELFARMADWRARHRGTRTPERA
ncbi:MAG TPA: MBL fold metallo-hydrolase [Solirubrobacteraceae bacterium]|nr:MBL fold metallo-hydrolase [Solirubrobacteraceae bacterium]